MNDIVKCQLCGEPMPEDEQMFNYHGYSGPCPRPPLPSNRPTLVEIAYGFLWLDGSKDKRVHEARRMLLETLDKQEQKRGIQAAKGSKLSA